MHKNIDFAISVQKSYDDSIIENKNISKNQGNSSNQNSLME